MSGKKLKVFKSRWKSAVYSHPEKGLSYPTLDFCLIGLIISAGFIWHASTEYTIWDVHKRASLGSVKHVLNYLEISLYLMCPKCPFQLESTII